MKVADIDKFLITIFFNNLVNYIDENRPIYKVSERICILKDSVRSTLIATFPEAGEVGNRCITSSASLCQILGRASYNSWISLLEKGGKKYYYTRGVLFTDDFIPLFYICLNDGRNEFSTLHINPIVYSTTNTVNKFIREHLIYSFNAYCNTCGISSAVEIADNFYTLVNPGLTIHTGISGEYEAELHRTLISMVHQSVMSSHDSNE